MTTKTLDELFTGRVIDFRMVKGQQKQSPERYKGKILRGLVVKTHGKNFTTDEPYISITVKASVDDKIEDMGFNRININTIEIVNNASSMLFKLEHEGKL